jgi:hypothetical protein
MRVDLGMAERWKAGRSCWASGRLTELVTVDSMRCGVTGFWTACLMKLGRIVEAIAQSSMCNGERRGRVEVQKLTIGIPNSVVDNASGVEC